MKTKTRIICQIRHELSATIQLKKKKTLNGGPYICNVFVMKRVVIVIRLRRDDHRRQIGLMFREFCKRINHKLSKEYDSNNYIHTYINTYTSIHKSVHKKPNLLIADKSEQRR